MSTVSTALPGPRIVLSVRQVAGAGLALALAAALPACGDDDDDSLPTADAAAASDGSSDAPDAAAGDLDAPAPDAPAGPLTLTSSALEATDPPSEFTDRYTCAGDDLSLPLAWSGGPAGIAGYAVVLEDTDNGNIHWIIWDLPAALSSLPEGVPEGETLTDPPGAKQSRSYDASWHGYLGPCPGGNDHVYVFTLYAVDVAEVPDVTPSSNRDTIREALEAHAVATATLTGHSDASRP
jgi:Raf kinase inhibitor-like YbhB/YbcL family protein